MKKAAASVPHYELSPLARAGILTRSLGQPTPEAEHGPAVLHRDTHHLLVLLTEGTLAFNLDFAQVALTAPALLMIFPGQVHQLLRAAAPQGWAVSFEPSLLDAELQRVLEAGLQRPLPLLPETAFYTQVRTLTGLLAASQASPADAYTNRTTQALLSALLSTVAGQLAPPLAGGPKPPESRGVLIERAFGQLLRQHYQQWKRPACYAGALAISVAHLNDMVKARTGLPVSTHIQRRAVLEAKRRLFFTERSIKEISYELGYDEPGRFGKLFKKETGLTPQQFRRQFRD